ncbi:MAG: NADP-dependent malic enzyme [Rhodospirillales bacterium]|nr:NADP-dependent malic enzyme [Rhodospirillales bacterium]MBO6785742.1 NADP-dependent malic enzyme [Rhodospirillales bacterium]
MSDKTLDQRALEYHRQAPAGKLQIQPTKPLATQRDLALAYSPGVAAACNAIVDDPMQSYELTNRANLVAVISNGTAVLGLGPIGAEASKPVMEGKAVLFKKFANIDCFDIEVNELDPMKLVEVIAPLEPTFGAINLEDIRAPECFIVEQELRKRMNIPVFHDDQHGTAIVCAAAILNGLRLQNKKFEDIKLVSTGGGAAGIACLDLLVSMGVKRENIWLVDHIGLVYEGRKEEMNDRKASYAQKSDLRSLDDVIARTDVFLGLSAAGILKPEMVKKMDDHPFILALANPNPEIDPDTAKQANPNVIMATGRSDYPNQVNNVLCFPFIFRGALDCGATDVNEEMKQAAVKAIADLAMAESSERVADAYSGEELVFGPEYLIPKPFDPRLICEIAPAVAKAAMDTGVAARPIEDFDAYGEKLAGFVFRSGLLMKPILESARNDPKRIIFAEGEDERVLRAVQALIDDRLARPHLVGRPDVIMKRIERLGLRIQPDVHFGITNPQDDPRYEEYWSQYHALVDRKGVTIDEAKTIIRTNTTAIAAMALKRGETDAMICGTYGQYEWHLKYVLDIVGRKAGAKDVSAMSALILSKGTYFLCDTHVTPDPTPEEIVEMTELGAETVRRFGITPKVALLSHSNFGSSNSVSAQKMREAMSLLLEKDLGFEVDGEMKGDSALDAELRKRIFPRSRLDGAANMLVFPNIDAANTAFNLLKMLGDGLSVGPILVGAAQPAHILSPAVTSRGIYNMSAVAVLDAQNAEKA